MMGSTPSERKQHPQKCILQQLFELSWRQLCARPRHGHSDRCELGLDVALLQITEECGGRDPLGGAIRRTLHHDFVKSLHQLLLLRSHISFLFIEK
ncbi:hypothetical protein F7725_015668 [Dissostichus mawsoni]|uniref:Uncharacterized protein n=1 Tax=Dissostichus mawsoni TaxID=36200 RepID=A0A7J5YIJ6_DISMA|nr:hypothetical protein F7725_015668 [Dissostichus mawsoni]